MAESARRPPGRGEFGALLRRHREAATLSQEALAERAGISLKAVSEIERGARNRPHLETVRLLADALGLEPADRRALAAARSRTASDAPSEHGGGERTAEPTALPIPPTPLLGREHTIANVLWRLRSDEVRLLTLTGPGGVGKTRLALAVATELSPLFPGGVIWVELAALADPTLVPTTVVQALEVREDEDRPLLVALQAHLSGRRTLLVLDNCEHLRQAVGEMTASLLMHCPDLRVLATSRAPLHLRAEQLAPVDPLTLPDPSARPTPAAGKGVGSIALFVARVRTVRPDFVLTEDNAADVFEICRRLDGLPLALELAAARARVLSIPVLRSLLANRLRLLDGGALDVPARHRTLSDTIAWSYDLLDVDLQALFRGLAVFAGGATLDAVSTVMTTEDPFVVLDGLESLVDEGLLQRTEDGEGEIRVRMLETIREFAVRQLTECGEDTPAYQRHLAYFVRLAAEAEVELTGPAQATWLDRLMSDIDNLRGAFAWALEQRDALAALRLSTALWRFWIGRGLRRDGQTWLERALAIDTGAEPDLTAKAFYRLGTFAIDRSDYDEARVRLEESLAIRRRAGDMAEVANALDALGVVASEQGEFGRARVLFEEAYAIRREHVPDDRRGRALSLYNLAEVTAEEGDYPRASELYEQALTSWSDLGDQSTFAYVCRAHGIALRLAGDDDRAADLTQRALALFRHLRDDYGIGATLTELGRLALQSGRLEVAAVAFAEVMSDPVQADQHGEMIHNWVEAVEGLAWVARRRGEHERAARLLGTTTAFRRARRLPFPSRADRERHELGVARLAAEMGPSWQANWEIGLAATPQQAAADALHDIPP